MKYLKFLWMVLLHKAYVFWAGRKLKVPLWQLIIHDWTKFTPVEFFPYSDWSFGEQKNPETFSKAWLHHQNHNPHHWEYWLARTTHVRQDDTMKTPPPLPMPERYVREMVADWMGASKFYTGSWDITAWVNQNIPRIWPNLHVRTQILLEKVLREAGVDFKKPVKYVILNPQK